MKHTKILIGTLLLLLVTVGSSVRNSRGYDLDVKACKQFNRQIHIFRPQGLSVTQRATRNLRFVGLEVYINQQHRPDPVCDVCANATATGGRRTRLQINHPSIVVLPGDTFQYTVTKRYRNGPPRHFSCEFKVNGDRMLFAQPAQTRSCPEAGPASSLKLHPNYTEEKRLLEEIISEMLTSCQAADTTKMLVLSGHYVDIESAKALRRYVLDCLRALLPAVDWHSTVENVYRSDGKFIFDVKSVLMKLKILHTVRGTEAAKSITDFDTQERSAFDNEDYFDEDYDESTTSMVELIW